MARRLIRSATFAFVAMMLPVASVVAQHDGHATAGTPQSPQTVDPAALAACIQSQQEVMVAAGAASRRLELARQTNQPAAMRAAIDDLQGVLSAMRTQLAPCAKLEASAAPAADPRAGHVTPVAPAPAGAAGHVMVQTAFDPSKLSCSDKIDPKTAAKTTYEGKTYYFCSARERDEFLKNPAVSLAMMPPKQ